MYDTNSTEIRQARTGTHHTAKQDFTIHMTRATISDSLGLLNPYFTSAMRICHENRHFRADQSVEFVNRETNALNYSVREHTE